MAPLLSSPRRGEGKGKVVAKTDEEKKIMKKNKS